MKTRRTNLAGWALAGLLASAAAAAAEPASPRGGADPADWRSTISRVARECGPAV
ncbi:MAG: hypothetical protein HGA98_01755, partial [Deltaproteobacteria bacterium]|nr:hypothetical protein [Deltaproteobacteria bacterium]